MAGLGLQRQATFDEYISYAQMPAFLGNLDIFVLPSSEEFVIAATEASAVGTPVVATRTGGTLEVVDGVTGILVEPRNEQALAAGIAALVEDGSLRERMGQAGREYVLSRYRWEDNAAKMAKLYEDLLQRTRGKAL